MADFYDVVKKRGCYRGEFTSEKLSRAELERIVSAGLVAPSACNCQSTTFVIVDDEKLIKEIAGYLGKPFVATAAALIVVVADPSPTYGAVTFYKEDAAAAVENILLAIADGGWASVWLDGVLRVNGIAEKIAKLLSIPSGRQVQILLPVGRAKEPFTQKEKLPFEKRAWFNQYGTSR